MTDMTKTPVKNPDRHGLGDAIRLEEGPRTQQMRPQRACQ